MEIFLGRIDRREIRLRVEAHRLPWAEPDVFAGSRQRYLHASVDGGEDTPWTERWVGASVVDALSRRRDDLTISPEMEGKIRRRCEDALRKGGTATLMTVAALLGVKTE